MRAFRKRIVPAFLSATIASAGSACGFHEPSAMARGMMNWVYPDSLHVSTAVWKAQSAGALAQNAGAERPNPLAFARTAFELQRLSRLLDARRGGARPSLAVVLLGPMLWSRFDTAADALVLEVHAEGPARGDVVVVTEAPVVTALVTGSLTARDAVRLGLVRIYAPAADAADALDWLSAIEP